MQINTSTAATDNDFISHLAETKLPIEKLTSILRIVFSELELTAIMHPLVYEKELVHSNERIKTFFTENIVQKVEFADIFQEDDTKQKYYIFLLKELYKSLRDDELIRMPDKQLLTYWKSRSCLGEIHSAAMCLICGCNIFLSDDGDSKKLADIIKSKFPNSINVYNRKDLIDKHLQEGVTKYPSNTRSKLTHKPR